MTKHLPEWIMTRYSKLWSKFKEKEFTREQAERLMPKDSAIAVFFSELRKAGWVEMKMSQEDARKTVYKLKDPTKAIIEEINELNKK
jgi:DNA-binding MarR family transcriptional regulator